MLIPQVRKQLPIPSDTLIQFFNDFFGFTRHVLCNYSQAVCEPSNSVTFLENSKKDAEKSRADLWATRAS